MFGLKSDWALEAPPRYYTIENYEGAVARWCPGCGDHAILTAVQKICRDKQLAPEKTVCVSGIGCSSRFPHYMKTFGFHGLHGRALPVACGVKSRRPDLAVWVATGDGDCCSIGAGHWVHGIRYNMDMTMMLFDNNIYGLTKKQTSPTSGVGTQTNTHPHGALLPPINPLSTTLGIANVSFVAQTVDWNPAHLQATLLAGYEHPGLAFIRILQRCPVFMPGNFDAVQATPEDLLLLEHDDGVQLPEAVRKTLPTRVAHDQSDIGAARAVAERTDVIPIGVLFQDRNRPRYDLMTSAGMGMTIPEKARGLEAELERFEV
jgi:2-oxoglutarate ferredoxin oxidoreductase subunit beta